MMLLGEGTPACRMTGQDSGRRASPTNIKRVLLGSVGLWPDRRDRGKKAVLNPEAGTTSKRETRRTQARTTRGSAGRHMVQVPRRRRARRDDQGGDDSGILRVYGTQRILLRKQRQDGNGSIENARARQGNARHPLKLAKEREGTEVEERRGSEVVYPRGS